MIPFVQSIILTELGIAILEDKKCIKSFPFAKPAKEYANIRNSRCISDINRHIASARTSFLVSHRSLYNSLKSDNAYLQMMGERDLKVVQSSKLQLLIDAGFADGAQDATSKLRNFAMELSSLKVSQISGSQDLHIVQAIGALDEMDREINILSSRIREWYGLHFPELENTVDSMLGYVRIVSMGERKELDAAKFEAAGFPPEKVEMLMIALENSRGGSISPESLTIVKALSSHVQEMYRVRMLVEEHIESAMKRTAPNLAAILGASVGARILARAGSLKKLALMPSSTIQVLGAEKALFHAIKSGSSPPKHGLLFQHPLVHAAPRWQRGKVARTISAKAAIAARVDLHQGGLNDTLLEKLNVRIKEIGEKFAEPAPKQSRDTDKKHKKKSKKRFDKRRR